MRRTNLVAAAAAIASLPALMGGLPAQGHPSSPNGQIAFERYNPKVDDTVIAVVNPDGSGLRNVLRRVGLSSPHWSPDGTRIVATAFEDVAATIFNVDTGDVTTVPLAYLPLNMGCFVWSPDAARLACDAFNGGVSRRNGIYTLRASDGLGLRRVTSNPGGEDFPGSYSPNGKQLEFGRFTDDGPVGLFVVKLDGRGLRRITPPGAIIGGDRFGDWSPQGNDIIFAQHANADVKNSIWVVHANGSGLREIHFDSPIPCGGAFTDPNSRGCFDPTWSPDGNKIAFIVNEPAGEGESVYTANVDGTHLRQVTHGDSEYPDWGTHPLT